MHVCFMQMSERVAASLGDSLFAKVLYCLAFLLVKADCIEDGASKSRICS